MEQISQIHINNNYEHVYSHGDPDYDTFSDY